MISMNSGFVESQGVKIHYLTDDCNDPKKVTLLFVPGVMMPAWIWEKQLAYFSKNFRVVAMEPRSQGDSGQSSEGHDAFSMAKDIKTLVDTLNLQPLVLIGWSIGVPQVVNYVAHFDSKGVIGLVLIDGIVGLDPSLPFYQSMVDYWSQFQMDRIPQTRAFVDLIFKQPQTAEYLEKLIKTAMRTPTNTVMTLLYNYMLQDFRALLPDIEVPTWIATIEGPRLEYMQAMNDLLPNSRFEIFKAAGHALFVDQPERFNHLLESFIEGLKKENV